eukprot:1013568-Karenia_brevis.AAC.1
MEKVIYEKVEEEEWEIIEDHPIPEKVEYPKVLDVILCENVGQGDGVRQQDKKVQDVILFPHVGQGEVVEQITNNNK